ncbi:MAG TPA: LysR family transcriptional regulator, partial [Janthinobacterium sp.]|nr:LysR family transcriptional regulator [Janthinobacterium sp.]
MSIKVDIKVRLLRDAEIAMGPGKADLLEAIQQSGSISAAARRMDMSYRRAWLLVDVMNRSFRAQLVSSAVGGQRGGGAHLTETGIAVLAQFRGVQAA